MLRPEIHRSRGPVIRRETVGFVRTVSEDGLWNEPFATIRFKREIVWIREARAIATLRLGARELTLLGSFSDMHYGLFSCIEAALDETRWAASRENLRPGHDLTARVDVEVSDVCRTPSREAPQPFADSHSGAPWAVVPDDWFIDDRITARWLREAAKPFERRVFEIRPHRPSGHVRSYLAWSSQNDPEANEKLIAAIKAAETPEPAP